MTTNATDSDSLPRRVDPRRKARRFQAAQRPDIVLPDGRVLKPRLKIADELGISERTVRRMNANTTFVGNVAYVDESSVLQLIADTIERRNKPRRGRRA